MQRKPRKPATSRSRRSAEKRNSAVASLAPTTVRTEEGVLFKCDLCGALMIERHCKLVCTNCGYTRDCSDP